MTPEAEAALTAIHEAERPLSAKEIYARVDILERENQAYHYCHRLAKHGLIEAVSQNPKQYRVTPAGRAALNGKDNIQEQKKSTEIVSQAESDRTFPGASGIDADAEPVHSRGGPTPGGTDEDLKKLEEKASQLPVKCQSSKRLAAFLDRRLAVPPPPRVDTDARELDDILDTLNELIQVLKRHLPEYEADIKDLEKAGKILQQLRMQISTHELLELENAA